MCGVFVQSNCSTGMRNVPPHVILFHRKASNFLYGLHVVSVQIGLVPFTFVAGHRQSGATELQAEMVKSAIWDFQQVLRPTDSVDANENCDVSSLTLGKSTFSLHKQAKRVSIHCCSQIFPLLGHKEASIPGLCVSGPFVKARCETSSQFFCGV